MSVYTIMTAAGWESGTLNNGFVYWVGGDFYNSTRNGAGVANYDLWKIRVPKSGTIVVFTISMRLASTGTSETVQHFIRINDTTDVAQIDLAYDTIEKIGINTTVNQAINAGDYISGKVLTPTWGTQPQGVRWRCEIGIQF